MAGRAQIFLGSLPSVWGQVKAGQLRAIAVTSPQRSSFVPQLPTVAEATGSHELDLEQWWGVFAPAKTPPAVVTKLNAEIRQSLATEELRTWLATQGVEPAPSSSADFTDYFRADIARWQKVVEASGIGAEEFK
jgi:tripartite-type tricarboxylate transporter receptor subunit TctC